MSRYIDADNLHNAKFQSISGYGENVAYRVGWNDAIDAICENEPSIDIVRCKECAKAFNAESELICNHLSGMAGLNVVVNPDDFCSYGARMTERSE